jgi:hypothetical protein
MMNIGTQSTVRSTGWAPPKLLPPPELLAPPKRTESSWAPPVLGPSDQFTPSEDLSKGSLKDELIEHGKKATRHGILALPGAIETAVEWTADTARNVGAEALGDQIESKHKGATDAVMDKVRPLATLLGPKAAPVQAARGLHELSDGLTEKDKGKQLKGLTNTATAVGVALSVFGVGTVPGLALAGVATGTRLLYDKSETFQKVVDKGLGIARPPMALVNKGVRKVAGPILRVGSRILKGKSKDEAKPTGLKSSRVEQSSGDAPRTLAIMGEGDIWGNSYTFAE